MIGKLSTALWFARRPKYWAHAAELSRRKLAADHDSAPQARAATEWAVARAVPVEAALATVGLAREADPVPAMPPELLSEGSRRAEKSAVQMGGPGDVDLLYAAAKLSGALVAVETGVAYGWSSLAILAALEGREGVRLISVDMPYPKMNNEAFVGIVVPERLRASWTIVREPDRRGLEKALRLAGGSLDLSHYDSDKSWRGRQYGFPLLWNALRPGGVFISDDIQDNMAFAEFVAARGLRFAVTESKGKYVGIVRKL
jgi:predicted O-methyltransferase YrrM